MKKQLTCFALVFVLVLSLFGCASEEKAYFNEVKAKRDWQGYETNGKIMLSVTDKRGESLRLPLELKLEAKDLNKAPRYHFTLDFGKADGDVLLGYYIGMLRAKQFEYYLGAKENKLYMKKVMFEESDKIAVNRDNFPTPLNRVDEAYLSMPLNEAKNLVVRTDAGALIAETQLKKAKGLALVENYFLDFKPQNLKFKKGVGYYRYELNDEALLEEGARVMRHLTKKWPEAKIELLPLFKELGFLNSTDKVLALEKKLNSLAQNPNYKKSYKGSNLVYEVSFRGDEVITKGSLNLMADNEYKIKLAFDFVTRKNDLLTFELPKSVYPISSRSEFLYLVSPIVALENQALVSVDGTLLDEVGLLEKGRTLIPFRRFCEAIGAKVDFDKESKTITIKKGLKVLTLTLGQKKAYLGNKIFNLDVVPVVKNDKTYVPLRFIGEAFDYKVAWDKRQFIAILEEK